MNTHTAELGSLAQSFGFQVPMNCLESEKTEKLIVLIIGVDVISKMANLHKNLLIMQFWRLKYQFCIF
jgi:hypothetical protein